MNITNNTNLREQFEIYHQPELQDLKNCVFIIDKNLKPLIKSPPEAKESIFYFIEGGEQVKTLAHYNEFLNKFILDAKHISPKKLKIICIGGGSIGDFCGFLASTFKRGVQLYHCPSTWLAAIDSAHGGKNALNIGHFKNQIGTFYSPHKIFIIKELLDSCPEEIKKSSLLEMLKICLLRDKVWFKEIAALKELNINDFFWAYLDKAIQHKYYYIENDPYENVGLRTELNFGHTMGHIIESNLGIHHGRAIGFGILFALEWSLEKGIMSKDLFKELCYVLEKFGIIKDGSISLRKEKFLDTLSQDKKLSSSQKVKFIFLKEIGSAIINEVSIEETLIFAQKNGWVTQ